MIFASPEMVLSLSVGNLNTDLGGSAEDFRCRSVWDLQTCFNFAFVGKYSSAKAM